MLSLIILNSNVFFRIAPLGQIERKLNGGCSASRHSDTREIFASHSCRMHVIHVTLLRAKNLQFLGQHSECVETAREIS